MTYKKSRLRNVDVESEIAHVDVEEVWGVV